MTAILITFLVTLAAVYAGWALRRWHMRARAAAEIWQDGPICDVCGVHLAPDIYRRHDGAWRCRAHKAGA